MSPAKLLIGTIILVLIYFFIVGNNIEDRFDLYMPLYEAAIYTLVILFAYNVKRLAIWLFLPIAAALLNATYVATGAITSAPIIILSRFLGLSKDTEDIVWMAYISALGALLFCLLLHLVSISKNIKLNTYLLVASLCSFAGILTISAENQYFLAVHKSIWLFMFSVGLILSESKASTSSVTSNYSKVD